MHLLNSLNLTPTVFFWHKKLIRSLTDVFQCGPLLQLFAG